MAEGYPSQQQSTWRETGLELTILRRASLSVWYELEAFHEIPCRVIIFRAQMESQILLLRQHK